MNTALDIRSLIKAVVARVTTVDTDADRVFTHRFDRAPIRIGTHRASDLRLRHARVARRHGEIGFASDRMFFRNLAWTKDTSVDGRRLARGEAVALTEESVIAIGPFEIDVCLCRPPVRERERARRVTPLCWPPFSIVDLAQTTTAGHGQAQAGGDIAAASVTGAALVVSATGETPPPLSPHAWQLLR